MANQIQTVVSPMVNPEPIPTVTPPPPEKSVVEVVQDAFYYGLGGLLMSSGVILPGALSLTNFTVSAVRSAAGATADSTVTGYVSGSVLVGIFVLMEAGGLTLILTRALSKRTLIAQVKKLSEDINKLSQENLKLGSDVDRFTLGENSLKESVEKGAKTVKDLTDQLDKKTSDLTKTDFELTKTTEKLSTIQKLYDDLKKEIGLLTQDVKVLDSQSKALDTTAKGLNVQVTDLGRTDGNIKKELAEAENERLKLEDENKQITERVSTLMKQEQEARQQLALVQKELDALKQSTKVISDAGDKFKQGSDTVTLVGNQIIGKLQQLSDKDREIDALLN